VRAWREFPFGDGQLIPHVSVTWDEKALGLTHEQVVEKLLNGEPRIAVQLINPGRYGFGGNRNTEIRIHPHTLQEGEDITVVRRLREVLAHQPSGA